MYSFFRAGVLITSVHRADCVRVFVWLCMCVFAALRRAPTLVDDADVLTLFRLAASAAWGTQAHFFDTFSAYMQSWIKFATHGGKPPSGDAAAAGTQTVDSKAESKVKRQRTPTSGSVGSVESVESDSAATAAKMPLPGAAATSLSTAVLQVDHTGAIQDSTSTTAARASLVGPGSSGDDDDDDALELSSLLQDTELSSLLKLRSLYFVDRHATCLCCTFADDETKEDCRRTMWEQLLGKDGVKHAVQTPGGASICATTHRGCRFSETCVFTPCTTAGYCNAHRHELTNSVGNEQNNWVLDDLFSRCMYCQKSFDIMLRRHHCR
jgi:hypothetical protein